MRNAILLLSGLALAVLLFAPSGLAGTLRVTDVRILDRDDTELRLVPANERVKLVATVTNLGTAASTGSMAVRFEILFQGGIVLNETGSSSEGLDSDESANVTVPFTAKTLSGPEYYYLNVTVNDDPPSRNMTKFRVTETSVRAGNLGERVLDHWWFFLGFVATFALFAAVLRVRRT